MVHSIFFFSFAIAICMALCCGLLSPFVMVRRRGLLSDVISHSTLVGIGFSFWMFQNTSTLMLLLGALFSSLLAFVFVLLLRKSKLNEDAILAVVLTTFFGGGLVMFSLVARLELGSSAGLTKFLFGNLSALWVEDLQVFLFVTALVVVSVLFNYKKWKLLAFDHKHGNSMHYSMRRWSVFFDLVVLLVILVGVQTVGVVLMGAMLVAPAAVAKQWTGNFITYYLLSVIFAVVAAFLGVWLSANFSQLPPGPVIVLVLSVFFGLSAIKNIFKNMFLK